MSRNIKVIILFVVFNLICFTNTSGFAQDHYHLLKKTVIGGEGGWDYLSLDVARGHLFIAHNSQMEVYDINKDSVVTSIKNTEGVHGIAIASAEQHGFISCGKSNSVLMIDLNTLDTLKRVTVGSKPDAIIYDPASKHVFVMNGKSNDISVLDAVTGALEKTIKLSGAPEFAVSDQQGHIYVNLEDKNTVVKIDSKKNRFLATWPLSPGEGPTGIAIDLHSETLFSVCANGKLITVSTKNGKIKDVVPIGKGADAVVFDSATGKVIASCGDGTATVVTAGSDDWINASVSETIQTALGARTIALDPHTHNLFFDSAEFGQAPAPTQDKPHPRGAVIPGTFMVLKYGLAK
jgi:YVTN family beta-propeller protein